MRAPRFTALVVFGLLAAVHTWPLARNPAHLSRVDSADAMLNIWAISWVAHQLPRDPAHLFDGNLFYPERLSLAYSEAMIVQGVMALPIIAAGGSPVLAYNLVLMAGFAFTGWAFCLLVQRWTASWAAGYVSGSLAAFNAHVLVRLTHLQAQHVEFVALILFGLDRLIASRRGRDAVLLGVGFALQGLTSVYLLVFSTWALIFAVLARSREWLRRDPARMAALFAFAAATAVLLMAPYLLAYYELHRLAGFERRVDEAQRYAGSLANYLSTGSRLHYALWSSEFYNDSTSCTFPGFVAMILVILAIVWPDTWGDARVRMCLVVAIGCATVSLLPKTPIYPALHRVIPLFRAVRVPAHIGQIVLLMVAVMAGFGVAGLERRCWSARAWPWLGVVLCALVNLEALRAPLGYEPFTEVPPIYGLLANEADAVVIELPFYEARRSYNGASYMLNSTRHWRPILNGYSGFSPRSYDETYAIAKQFPDAASLDGLRRRGVTHVVVHEGYFSLLFGRDRFSAIARATPLQPVAAAGDIHMYRLK